MNCAVLYDEISEPTWLFWEQHTRLANVKWACFKGHPPFNLLSLHGMRSQNNLQLGTWRSMHADHCMFSPGVCEGYCVELENNVNRRARYDLICSFQICGISEAGGYPQEASLFLWELLPARAMDVAGCLPHT